MRQVTQKITTAFLEGRALTVGNTRTDGTGLWLHGNHIADKRTPAPTRVRSAEGGYDIPNPVQLWITTAGWDTMTTRDRLNALPGVRIHRAKGRTYLNGKEWDGTWVSVDTYKGQEDF